jgi:hypothetical protein
MTHIELPRALEAYFAHAEIDPTRAGRRFTITLPYFEGNRLDRLQWWYHLRQDQEQRHGDAAIETLRAEAIERFSKHIERWLQNTGKRLHGMEPIPRIDAIAPAGPASTAVIEEEKTAAPPIAATSNAA